jgi:antitoxin (DNA-binding transcriptional repressor) of toxin-antitoxin stability system
MTQRLPSAAARKSFATVLRDSAGGERIKLTRYNKTVAVIIPKKDLTELEDCQKSRAGAEAEQAPPPKPSGRRNRRASGEDKGDAKSE